MAFTVREYRDLLTLLNAHPEWREELRNALLSEDFLALPRIVRELGEAQKRTEERLETLAQRVDELAEAQKRTEARLETLAQRVDELAEAQKRTEQRVEELAEAQKRTEARLETLAQRVDELAEAQKRTEARLETLAQRVDELAEAQKRTEQRVEELAEAQKRTEQRVEELAQHVDHLGVELQKTRSELRGLSAMFGVTLEEEAGSVLETVMRQKGYRALQEAGALRLNEEVDVILPLEDPQGRQVWAVLESKARLSRKDVQRWDQRTRSKGWRKALVAAGCPGPYLVYMYAVRADVSAREAAKERGIGLLKSDGEVFPPRGEMQ